MRFAHRDRRPALLPLQVLRVSGSGLALSRFALLAWWEAVAVELEAGTEVRIVACQPSERLRIEDLAYAAGCLRVSEVQRW